MKINIISTGSSGNLYELIDKEGNSMLIEAGEPRHKYMKHRVGKGTPEMCIISHQHSDHCKYWGEYAAITEVHKWQIKNESASFKAYGFPQKHGEGKSMAFLIKSIVEDKFVFFATDLEYSFLLDKTFDMLRRMKVQYFLIECNYNDYLMSKADDDIKLSCSRHLSDNDVVKFFKNLGAPCPKIITIHGSNRVSADTYTKNYLQSKIIGARVFCAVGAKDDTKNLFTM